MKQLKAIELEEPDFQTGPVITQEANDASVDADLVIFRGQLVKNRHGPVQANLTALRADVLGKDQLAQWRLEWEKSVALGFSYVEIRIADALQLLAAVESVNRKSKL